MSDTFSLQHTHVHIYMPQPDIIIHKCSFSFQTGSIYREQTAMLVDLSVFTVWMYFCSVTIAYMFVILSEALFEQVQQFVGTHNSHSLAGS